MKNDLAQNVKSAKVRNPDLDNPTCQLGPTQGPLLLFDIFLDSTSPLCSESIWFLFPNLVVNWIIVLFDSNFFKPRLILGSQLDYKYLMKREKENVLWIYLFWVPYQHLTLAKDIGNAFLGKMWRGNVQKNAPGAQRNYLNQKLGITSKESQ